MVLQVQKGFGGAVVERAGVLKVGVRAGYVVGHQQARLVGLAVVEAEEGDLGQFCACDIVVRPQREGTCAVVDDVVLAQVLRGLHFLAGGQVLGASAGPGGAVGPCAVDGRGCESPVCPVVSTETVPRYQPEMVGRVGRQACDVFRHGCCGA